MFTTPKFSSLIDFIVVSLDAFEGRSRKKMFSELKTFSAKKVYFSDLFDKLKIEIGLSEEEVNFISQSLIKVENVLSHLKNIPLYTDVSQSAGGNLFFYQFTVPFVKQMCGLIHEYTSSVFFCTLEKLIFKEDKCNDLKEVMSLFKKEISSELQNIDANTANELKLTLSKLDHRSFLSKSSVRKNVDILHQNILVINDKDKAGYISSRINAILYAAKIAFYFTKYRESKRLEEIDVDSEIVKLFLLFGSEYIFNDNISSGDDSYINNVNFISCKNYLLERINQADPVLFLKENGTRALWQYKNGIFISYAIREQLLWDVNKGRFDTDGIDGFIKNLIPELCKRQTGTDGVDIAVILIGMKIITSKNITNNSLEPLINFYIDNLEKHTLINLVANTPFGGYIPSRLSASEINIALAVRTFNDSVREGVLNIDFCDPLSPLDEMLTVYFDKGYLTKRLKSKKPIKTEKVTVYDALRNINHYILSFGLQEEVQMTRDGFVDVQSSKSGDGINNYLLLTDSDKKMILNQISPSEFLSDLEN